MAEKLKNWKEIKNLGIHETLKPIIGNLILILEEERKKIIKKVEETKALIEKMENDSPNNH